MQLPATSPVQTLFRRYDCCVVGDETTAEPLIFPVGHYLGRQFRLQPSGSRGDLGVVEDVCRVRRGANFHSLTGEQAAVWTAACGSAKALEDAIPWSRQSMLAATSSQVGEIVEDLIGRQLLVEVSPGTPSARDFASTHRVVPSMLGLGNSADEPDIFHIGFLNSPVVAVSHAIYDLWSWSTMDGCLWDACENAYQAAQQAGIAAPADDPNQLLTGFLGALHALLYAGAASIDIDFRLDLN